MVITDPRLYILYCHTKCSGCEGTAADDYGKRAISTEQLYIHVQQLGSRDALEEIWPVKLVIGGGAKHRNGCLPKIQHKYFLEEEISLNPSDP